MTDVPPVFRAVVAKFDAHQLSTRDRVRRAGTKPRSDRTLEINLAAARDLALFLTARRQNVTAWTTVILTDIEAFLATIANTGYRTRQLHALQVFFRFARRARHVLIDPTSDLRGNSSSGFHCEVLDPARQCELFTRWTTGAADLHPHEPAVGLLGLLHGATPGELRPLRVTDIDLTNARITLGDRPQPTPLDPMTTTALRRCLDLHHRHDIKPQLLVSQKSKTTGEPVSTDYITRLLAPAGVSPKTLRATRLAHLVTVMDPVLVAAAFGIRHGATLHYRADTVDTTA